MKQFTQQEMAKIRLRAADYCAIIQSLQDDNATVLNQPLKVPQTGIATWNHYYYCPQHAVRLQWQYDQPTAHRCPVDGHIFSGEPYDGAWWRWLNGLNAKACQELGLLWQLTGEARYFNKVKDILLTYARYYPDYQEHGGIPYNGPGKANAQTLCEANCHLQFALGYDFIHQQLSVEERQTIEVRLLREGADFLMRHRHDQLHNHEVKISTTIGVIGLVIDEPRYVDFAVNSPYGLRYQLEHALLPGGMWFEGALHYHFYALQGFFAFEKVARHSEFSLLDFPQYRQMLTLPLKLLMPDNSLPRINDCIMGQEVLSQSDLYEFAWSHYADPDYAQALNIIYQHRSRHNLDALLYGSDAPLPPADNPYSRQPYHDAGVGFTLMRHPEQQRTLLVKHAPYGGEHDHYDRLGIILFNHGHEVLPDLGTTGYGVALHEGYYKNSATHNTLSVNQSNQPPAVPQVLCHHHSPQMHYLAAVTDWSQPVSPLDSFTQVKWDEKAYQDVVFRRQLLMLDNLLVDICQITNPHRQQVDCGLHIDGELLTPLAEPAERFATSGPLAIMSAVRTQPLKGVVPLRVETKAGTLPLWIMSVEESDSDAQLWQGAAPANPSTRDLCYLVARSHQPQVTFATVYDFDSASPLQAVDAEHQANHLTLTLLRNNQPQRLTFSLGETVAAPLIDE